MPMPAQPEHGPLFRASLRLAAFAAAGPSVAMLALTLLYAASDRHCERGSAALWTVWAGAVLCSAVAFSWLCRHRKASATQPDGARRRREAFLANTGLALNLISLLLLLAFAAPLLRLRPCQ